MLFIGKKPGINSKNWEKPGKIFFMGKYMENLGVFPCI